MKEISNFASNFNINKTNTYHLSLQFSKSGYTYSIADTIKRQYLGIKHVPFNNNKLNPEYYYDMVADVLNQDQLLSKNYKAVDLIYVSDKSTLIPANMFDKAYVRQLFEVNFQLFDYEEIHFNKLKSSDIYNVFVIPSYITTLFINTFPEIRFFHQTTPMIESLYQFKHQFKNIFVAVNVYYDFIDVLGIKQGKIQFFNTFAFKNNSDILYYITNIIAKHKLDPDFLPLLLSGYIEPKSELMYLLLKYFPKADVNKLNNGMKYKFNDVPDYMFRNVLSLFLCE